jgi:hypothetical protein
MKTTMACALLYESAEVQDVSERIVKQLIPSNLSQSSRVAEGYYLVAGAVFWISVSFYALLPCFNSTDGASLGADVWRRPYSDASKRSWFLEWKDKQ